MPHAASGGRRRWRSRKVGAAVVCDSDGAGIGIITERDILAPSAAGEDLDTETAPDHQTTDGRLRHAHLDAVAGGRGDDARRVPPPHRARRPRRRRDALACATSSGRGPAGLTPSAASGGRASAGRRRVGWSRAAPRAAAVPPVEVAPCRRATPAPAHPRAAPCRDRCTAAARRRTGGTPATPRRRGAAHRLGRGSAAGRSAPGRGQAAASRCTSHGLTMTSASAGTSTPPSTSGRASAA